MTWAVRRASLRDRGELEALCRASVGEDDYVLKYLERAILRAVVHVALDGKDRIVGMMAYRPCIDGSGWLAMARTHPDVRRRGVARAIIESFVGMSQMAGIPSLRLWSESANAEGTASSLRAGFHEVAHFTRVVGPAARGPPKAYAVRYDEAFWSLIAESKIISRGKGYVAHDWYFVPATRPVAFAIAAKGYFRRWAGNLLAISDPDPRMPLEFAMWAGSPEELLAEGCRQAAAVGRAEAATFVPHDRDLLGEARRAGFHEGSWGRDAILFELAVAPTDIKRRTRRTYAEMAGGHGQTGLGWAHWNP